MNILWVKVGGMVPLDTGGKIRSYHIAKQLAARNEVSLFAFYAAHENDVHRQLESVFKKVFLCPLKLPENTGIGDKIRYLAHAFSTEPYTMSKFCQPQVKRSLAELLAKERFDLVLADFLNASAVLPTNLKVPVVVFTHNVETLIWKRHYEVEQRPVWKTMYGHEYRRMRAAERRYLSRADHVLTVSQTDKDFFSEYLNANNVSVIPTGVDTEFFKPGTSAVHENSLVFTGSMDWAPNEDGIIYFAENILPLIRAEVPEVTLSVVGRSPSAKIRQLAEETPNINVTGRVDDIRPYVQSGAVYIVPLRIGSGTRLKIFEAMGMGKAIVSTTLGAEGLPVTHGVDVLLADEPEQFARETIRVLRDRSLQGQLGAAARKLVEENYSWASVADVCDRVLHRVVTHASAG